ncbi:MAG: hypothetical protein NXI18_19590 [Alphaproteobacteria bacterium]|nr:hypothetical protein [Alphaproteobacteria bacterium]
MLSAFFIFFGIGAVIALAVFLPRALIATLAGLRHAVREISAAVAEGTRRGRTAGESNGGRVDALMRRAEARLAKTIGAPPPR